MQRIEWMERAMSAAPDYIVTTGDFIAEWMEGEDISAAELLRRLGVSRKHMSELLSGKAPLFPGCRPQT